MKLTPMDTEIVDYRNLVFKYLNEKITNNSFTTDVTCTLTV